MQSYNKLIILRMCSHNELIIIVLIYIVLPEQYSPKPCSKNSGSEVNRGSCQALNRAYELEAMKDGGFRVWG